MSEDTGVATPSTPPRRSSTTERLDGVAANEYEELRALARGLRRRLAGWGALPGTDSLVHDAYLSLKRAGSDSWQDRIHFLAVASIQMRHLLVDYVRASQARKRGGEQIRVSLDEDASVAPNATMDVLALDEALNGLALHDARQHRVAELRLFLGLSVTEVAAMLDVSERTVKEDWRLARVWLAKRLRPDSRVDS